MTRPQEAAERFVAQLPRDVRARLTAVYSPLIGIKPVGDAIDFDDARGLIFTSSNGVSVAAALTNRRALPCYCVGAATARSAQNAGWTAHHTANNAETLIETLHRDTPDGPLLHLRGHHGRGNVAARLNALGISTREQVIYDQPLLPLCDAARKMLRMGTPVIVPIFSPRTARQFANIATGDAPLYIAALSNAVAEPLKSMNYNKLLTCPSPDASAMSRVVKQLIIDAGWVEGPKSAQ